MTLIEKLDSALSDLEIPFYPGYCQGDGNDYGIYEGTVETPEISADNEPQVTVCQCNVHLFVKDKRAQKKKLLLKLLRDNDFTISAVYEQYEPETDYTHYTAEVSILGENFETEV